MALNSTPRRRFGVALGVVLTGVTAGLIGFAGVASAHTPQVSAECKGETTTLKVNLTQYSTSKKKSNHVQVLDGTQKLADTDFQKDYKNSFNVSGSVAHDFTVHVKAWDDVDGQHGWSKDFPVHVDACVTVPPPDTETTTTTTTTTETTTTPAPSTTESTTTTTQVAPVVATSTTTPPPAAQGGPLAETGASIALPLGIAGVLLAGGVVMLFVVRRRSSKA
ncbi:LPXTG cell wall anchor domain-containing protein [Actinophytocola sp.]|uniref:LPXTG cell wall anchor domain-containing protein n=1 Tax=Actinophytocola sp. TaxID=1872138 RepID=UPI00389A9D89